MTDGPPDKRCRTATYHRGNAAAYQSAKPIWPDVKPEHLWDRAEFTGFTTIPRTLSLILRVIDGLDSRRLSRVYFDLWCRSFDDYVIDIKDEFDAASRQDSRANEQ